MITIKTNEFKRYHPIVNFIYFLFVIGFSMFFMHPVCLGISVACAFTYSILLKGTNAIKQNLVYILPIVIVTALVNPAFNHAGVTILTYLPDGNPLTLESIIYGGAAGIMLAGVICWFTCYNEVMTSDKFIYLFGRIIPSLSLVLSMILRFVPMIIQQIKAIASTQKMLGNDVSSGGILKRCKAALSILSATISWALENSVDTSDSMKARGYGLPGRTAFSIFNFTTRDLSALILILSLGIFIIAGYISGAISFSYFPQLSGTTLNPFNICLFTAYFALCLYPIIIELLEVRRWQAIKYKD